LPSFKLGQRSILQSLVRGKIGIQALSPVGWPVVDAGIDNALPGVQYTG
jgi:hypothetical protein